MKIVYLPLDERPCNYDFAQRIAAGTDVKLVAPPIEILGKKKTPADAQQLQTFLLENAKDTDACIIALDMLLYGGIVPSRLHQLTEDTLLARLQVLDEIKKRNPNAKIYAFGLITRCPCYSSDDEEPDYYEHCGREIFLTGQVKHKLALGILEQAEAKALLDQYSQKTGPYLADFEARRAVNRQMLQHAVSRLGSSIDFLVLPQDDSAPYGYTTMDREYLRSQFVRKGLDIAMYPGADEVGMTLLARAACEHYGKQPKIYCQYPKDICGDIIPLYEDRPVRQTLPFQIHSAGCEFADKADADILLYLNYPTEQPVEAHQDFTPGYEARDLGSFVNEIAQSIRENRLVAVADGALCNGGELGFVQMLADRFDLFRLCAYAGWNTSSNTLGTVICQSVFNFLFGKSAWQDKFLAERFYEDVGYCGFIRKFIVENRLPELGLDYFHADAVDGQVAAIVRRELRDYIGKHLPSVSQRYVPDICQMPWTRMFEVALTVKAL